MANHKNKGHAMSMPSGLALGAAVSMVITVVISFLGAQLILNEVIDQDWIGYCSLAALLTGAILGAVTSSRKIKRRKLMVCLLSGTIYFCLLLAVTALFFGGQYSGVGASFITVLLGSIAALLMPGREGKRSNKHIRKKL